MNKHALIVHGGWDGHTPKESAEVFAPALEAEGYTVTLRDTLDAYADADLMGQQDLIVPIWTMAADGLSDDQWKGLDAAIAGGCGLAGFHGGIIDSFRSHTNYQWMTGGQWVAPPGNCIPRYTVDVTDTDHEITRGIGSFELIDTEQYYCHIDPGVHVLCTTTFREQEAVGPEYTGRYPLGTVMPYAWTRQWVDGRVFVAGWGHTYKDFDVPEAKQLVLNGMKWATRQA